MPVKPQRLSTAERKALRARLSARAAELRTEVRDGLRMHPASAEEGFDEAAIASVARDQHELDQVTEALARIDTDGYGDCVDCGVGIAIARLMAEPFALRCMRCQARVESKRQAA